MKKQKLPTVNADPKNVLSRIKELEQNLKELNKGPENFSNLGFHDQRNKIKSQLRELYRIRKKQKTYIPPTTKIKTKGL